MKNLFRILRFIINHPLGRKKKLKFISRFFLWQVFSKIIQKKHVFQFVDNTKLNIVKGQTVATGNYYVGLLEFSEMSFVAHFLNKDETFFDIGTNIGTYTILASGVSKAKTYSFEPILKTFDYLKKNIELNNIQDRVVALNVGLSEKKGFVYFTKELDAKNHIVNTSDSETVKVEVKTLNEFKDANPILIKADVEGYEAFVLRGGNELLAQEMLKAIIIEVNKEGERYGIEKDEVHKLLVSYGFGLYEYDPFTRSLKKTEIVKSDNRLYIRDFEYVSSKVKQSNKINVAGIYI